MSALPPGSLRRALPVLPALLVLGACSSYTPLPAVSARPSADAVAAAAVGQEYAALDPAAREAELRRLSATVERQVVTLSGLEDELGGAAAADAAYLTLSRTLVGGASETTRARSFGRFGGSVPADQPMIGGLMVGNVVVAGLGAEAVTSSTNETTPTAPVTTKSAAKDGPGQSSHTISATVDEASMVAESEVTVDGITGKLRTVVTVNPCPDATGRFTSTTTMTAEISGASGRTGADLTIDVEIEGQVDDDAHLVSFEVDTRTRSATLAAGGKGPLVDQTVGWTNTDGKQHSYRAELGRTGGGVTDAFISDQSRWGLMTAVMMQDKAVDAARQGWESGRCVSLKPTTTPARRTGLAPGATLELVAPPRSTVDGTPVGGTVTATMTGATSVDPSATKVPADATFTVMVPGQKNKKSTVALEARSKRGVAKAKVAVDTKARAYTASGRSGNIRFRGTVADLTEPFTIRGGGGAGLTFSYTPSDAAGRSGTMTYTGTVGGLELSGSGGYSITGDEGGALLLTQGSKGCAAGPLGCVGGVAEITLTPSGS